MLFNIVHVKYFTAQKMKFSIIDFFGKCDQIRRKLMKFVMKNFIFYAVFSLKHVSDVAS